MTVSELRAALASFDGDLDVIVAVDALAWMAVKQIDPPCGDDDAVQRAVCLVPGGHLL